MPPVSVELKKRIKGANDIVDVVQSYIPVHPAGKIFKSLCPFHNDTHPSLQIDRNYQNYHCWACGARGDVFDFIEKYEKVAFPEALRILAQRAGIALEEAEPSPEDLVKSRMLDVMRWAEQRYTQCLIDEDAAEPARRYLGTRRLSGPTVRNFGLGFAPVSGDWLLRAAHEDKVPTDLLAEVGLLGIREENRGHYDRFRDRVMFPIRDIRGRTVGFGGRILPESPLAARGPKYYNSADTPLFSKSDLLFGLDLARHPGATEGFSTVVEGYTDVMMAHQCGVANVVATMGTALNSRHVTQLRRYAKKVVLVFDADEGGTTGVDRALELFIGNDLELSVATLPDGLDPCDLLIRDGGVDIFRQAVQGAVDALEFKLSSLLARESSTGVESSRRIVDAILGVMVLAPDVPSQAGQVRRELIITRLGHRLGLRQETVWARFAELKAERKRKESQSRQSQFRENEHSSNIPKGDSAPRTGPAPALERQLLEILLAEPELVAEASEKVAETALTHPGLRRMFCELMTLHRAGETADLDALRVRMLDRADLVDAAHDLRHQGRFINDRADWLKRVISEFGRIQAEAESKTIKRRLGAASEGEQLDLLRALQARGAG